MNDAIRIEDLRKSFSLGFFLKKKEILKGISLSVKEGEIFGYLGPNGAGKTTTIKCILGLIFPDGGAIEIFGQPHLAHRVKNHVGFLPENPYFYDYLTAREFLNYYGELFLLPRGERIDKTDSLLDLVGLGKAADLQLRKFSRGMLQRIGLAQALINDPKLVILDEPLGGLDPLGRKEIRDIIIRFKEEGKTVFLSSHILQDIEMICDRVAIIVGGRIVNQGYLHELISEKIFFTEIILSGLEDGELEDLGEKYSVQGGKVFLRVLDESKVARILALVHERNARIHSLIPRTETLEDIFVDTVKHK
ncbi:MAG TPA: ABC transporter ATP-binding protein [Candidatus Aminicenantes bacterium]|nr:ABC transporter ATP-binding protein [Candidatus Aminicenantes bacterium]